MNALLLLSAAALVSVVFGDEPAPAPAPADGYAHDNRGPYFAPAGYFAAPYAGYGYGLHPAVRNDLRQIEVNKIAEAVGAGVGRGRDQGVPGSTISGYDTLGVYEAYPRFAGYPFYGGGPYDFYHPGYPLPATVVRHAAPAVYQKSIEKSDEKH